MSDVIELTRKDFVSDQIVRWCPGCGDYAILAQMQKVLPELGIPKENIVFISGIGCSSRFPYYMNTYGIHSIHGRAPTLAAGLKIANPELSVWVITGDGDGLSIGGNHLLHALRRNIDINIILFNNRIYGLTKGQYSPTSLRGTVTKSSPMGSIEHSFNPLSVALGAEAAFVARTIDTNVKHLGQTLKRAAAHKGTSFVEIYQNCIIFNNKTWSYATDAQIKDDNVLVLEHGQPMIFGKDLDKGIRLNELDPEIVSLDIVAREDLLVHNEKAPESSLAYLLSRMRHPEFPEPIGVFRSVEEPVYEEKVIEQIREAVALNGKGDLNQLYLDADTWAVLSEADEAYMKEIAMGEVSPPEGHSLLTVTLSDLQPRKPLVSHVDISLAEAVDQLQTLNVGFMALVDDEGKLAGVFTESDVFQKVACKVEDLSNKRIKDYMTVSITTLKADSPITYALHLMSLHSFRHILIVDDDNKPDGVISFRSVVHYIEEHFAPDGENEKK